MTITIDETRISAEAVELSGCELDFLFAEDFDEQIEERRCTFRFLRGNRGNMLYLNRILTSRKCQQSTMTERINALIGVTTSISPSFLVKD